MAGPGPAVRRRRRRSLLAALIALIVLLAALAPLVAPYPADQTDLAAQLQAPSAAHPLGRDFYGRDVLSRLLHGGRATLAVATVAVVIAAVAGSATGLLAGWMDGWAGQLWVGFFDLMLAFPALLLAMLVVAVLGPGLTALAVAVGIAGIPAYGRLVRGMTRGMRGAPFVEAAVSLGAGPFDILGRHLLRNLFRPISALATVDFGRAILNVAALGYLGLGATPPQAEWGLMLYEGRGYLTTAAWTSVAPGIAIAATVLVATLLGDALAE
jgi:peptide/nickel transport system permease protein